MNTILNLDDVEPGRVPGYPTNFLGHGWTERVNGKLVHGGMMRATIALSDEDARKVLDWLLDNPGHSYPYSVTSTNRIIGVKLVSEAVPV